MKTSDDMLREVALQLEDWAREAKQGGWSSQQVGPQRKLADKIYAHLYKKKERGLDQYDTQRW